MPTLPETIDGLIEMAEDRLAKETFDYVSGGSGNEAALRRNRAALDAISVVPRVLRDVSSRRPGTDFFGRPVALPLMMAPIGSLTLLDPAGAAAVAAAAAALPLPVFLSIMASPTLEDVARAAGSAPLVLQLYVRGDRRWLAAVAERAENAGCAALCVTVDTPVYSRRDRDIRNGFSPAAAIDRPNLPDRTAQPSVDEQAALTWDDIAWLKARTHLPLILKGVLATEDALRAVEIGCDAIYLSNHGGRQLDCAVTAIERLPAIRAALGPDVPLYVDGGFQSGSDILKAVALGADMIGLGKLQAFALTAGSAGVRRLLTLLLHEFDIALALSGVTSIAEAGTLEIVFDPAAAGAQDVLSAPCVGPRSVAVNHQLQE